MTLIRSSRLIVLVAVLFIASGLGMAQQSNLKPESAVAGKTHSSPATPAAAAVSPDYLIGPDDVLLVNVWKEPDLSRPVLVRPDGKITLPLLKDVDAGGSTPAQLQAKIEKALSDFISKPAVTVIVQEARSHKFNILGQVQKPGTYVISGPTTVLEAIALAGGFREWAKTGDIYILRESATGNRERIPFNYKKVVKGSNPDVQLKIKDTIVVP